MDEPLSAETANLLRAAGMPQPDFKERQTWYDYKNREIFIVSIIPFSDEQNTVNAIYVSPNPFKDGVLKNRVFPFQFTEDEPPLLTFAPTWQDIAKLIPGTSMEYKAGLWHFSRWFEGKLSPEDNYNVLSWRTQHENANEAAALGWMEQQKKVRSGVPASVLIY